MHSIITNNMKEQMQVQTVEEIIMAWRFLGNKKKHNKTHLFLTLEKLSLPEFILSSQVVSQI